MARAQALPGKMRMRTVRMVRKTKRRTLKRRKSVGRASGKVAKGGVQSQDVGCWGVLKGLDEF
jgi:hypothetical protein